MVFWLATGCADSSREGGASSPDSTNTSGDQVGNPSVGESLPGEIAAAIQQSGRWAMAGDWAAAVEALDSVIKAGANEARLFALRAHFRQNAGDFAGALADAEQATKLDPSYAWGYSTKAEVLMSMGRNEEALTNVSRAILLSPEDGDSYLIRARLQAATGRTASALADYDRVLALAPKGATNLTLMARMERAPLLAATGNYEAAVEDLNHLSKAVPTDARFYAIRGLIQAQLGRIAQGIQDCKKAVELDPSSVLALNNLAWLLAVVPDAHWRDGKQAVELATKACEITRWENPIFLGTLAAAYAEEGDFASALKWQEQAIALGISDSDLSAARRRLTAYQKHEPWRQILSDDGHVERPSGTK